VTNSEHEVDLSPQQREAAGALKSSGAGGETIWKEQLTPAEKSVLKRFFK
jgi:hypothetical protein